MLDRRNQKKLAIGLVYGAILTLLVTGVYFLFRPAPTCTDGKKNQNETGIDCGGVCGACEEVLAVKDMTVLETAWVPSGKPGKYDLLARVSNINEDIGAVSFNYTFHILGGNGVALADISGSSFVLPRDDRYLFEMNVSLLQAPSRVDLVVSHVQWEKLDEYREKPPINIYNRKYERVSSGVGFGVATGLVANESAYDFESVMVMVVLRDANGNPLGIQQNEMRTLKAGEQRDFKLVWPDPFPGDVAKVDVRSSANIYRSDSFIRQYLPAGAVRLFQNLNR